MRIKNTARAGLVLAMATIALTSVPGTAHAATCADDGTTVLYDPSGSYFDFNTAGATPDRDDPFAAFYDSGTNGPGGTPPGPRSNNDVFDGFGALFVGGTDVANMYFSADNNACASEEGGAEQVFPVVTLAGLQVQRKVYVRPAAQTGGLPGARILNLLTNTTGAPITTTVQVGDLGSGDNYGDLGSDSNTAVRSSSSGDAAAAAGDRWFVTSDHATGGGATNSDPAIAHIVDGPGARDAATLLQVGGGSDSTPQDNVAYRWQITVQPGETAALMSVIATAEAADGPTQAATADALAASIAQAYMNAAPASVYTGMSAAEIAGLRNWNDLEVKPQASAPATQKLRKSFSASLTCPEEACKGSFTGTLKVGKKSFGLATTQVTSATGAVTPVTVSLQGKKALKKVKKLIAKKPKLAKKVTVTITGTVSDAAGTSTATVQTTSKVKVKKPKKK